MNKRTFGSKLVASPYIVWSAIFIVVPLVIMFYFALTDQNGVFTLSNLSAIGQYKKAFGISILYAVISTPRRYSFVSLPYGVFYDKA